jgi:Helix-turn-helix domain
MASSSAKLTDSKAIADFLHEASIRLGISRDRLTTAVRASQALSRDELEVVTSLVDFAQTGAPLKKRSAVSRGIVRAINTVREAAHDPLAEFDEPMDAAEAAEVVTLGETESQAHREAILKQCVSAAEAAELTGRSRQALERLRREGRLLALRKGNQWRYPKWQFDADSPGGILPGLEEVMRTLDLSPMGTAFWLLEPYERLGGSPPIELLRRHRAEPVIQLAQEHSYMP